MLPEGKEEKGFFQGQGSFTRDDTPLPRLMKRGLLISHFSLPVY
jgi:hypothetical protein